MRIPGWPGPQCLSETISEEGAYDGTQTRAAALQLFFKTVYE